MSQGKLCDLCVTISQEHKCLYDDDGDENENYELVFKYFDPQCLFRGKEVELTNVCLSCWKQIYGFYNFQVSVYEAQKNLMGSSKAIHILEIESAEKGKDNELIVNPDINIKTEEEFLSEDEFTLNSENKYEPIEGPSVSLSYVPVKEISTISLPKLEITDVYSNDDSSENGLSDEYDDQYDSYLNDDSVEKDDSMGITPAEEHVEGIFSKHSRIKAIKDSDDIIAQWKRSLECELCSEIFNTFSLLRQHFQDKHSRDNEMKRRNAYQKKMEDVEMEELMTHADFAEQAKVCLKCVVCAEVAPAYSLLRQHFQSKHPQEKFYVLCCQQKLSLRYKIEAHVRLHIDPNAFKCDVCDKQFKESRYLLAHKRSVHNSMNDEAKQSCSKKSKTNEEFDDLIAQCRPNLECVVCKQVFNRFTLLQHHFREIHPQKQFQIKCCQRILKRRYEIYDHFRIHINPNAYKCDLCGICLRNRDSLPRHMKRIHPSSTECHLNYTTT